MGNTLGTFNPIFYAQEALIILTKALGMANRVHRGYDQERRSFQRGDVISIRKPSVFSAADAPATAADLAVETVNITLDKWREVKFKLTDKELALTSTAIIESHITPAAYALADDIDQKLAVLYRDVGWNLDLDGTTPGKIEDWPKIRKVMFDNGVPLGNPADLHIMIDSLVEQNALTQAAFSQNQGAGDQGISTQMRGTLGQKFGFEIFANQNVQAHVGGTCDDPALKLSSAGTKGDTTVNLTAVDAGVAGTLVAGDSFIITGDPQRYAVTALNTAAANVFTGVAISPALKQSSLINAAVTVDRKHFNANLAFHRNAFALVVAPLPEIGNQLGAKIAVVTDPITGLSLRSRLYYVGNSSEVHVALDVLYGVKTLDPNLACRVRDTLAD